MMAGQDILPALSDGERRKLAAAILADWAELVSGRAGRTLTMTDADGRTIRAGSPPLEVVAYRMRQYRSIPTLFVGFVNRHNDGAPMWVKLTDHLREVYPDAVEAVRHG